MPSLKMGYAILLPTKEHHAHLETHKRRQVDDSYVVDAIEDGRGFETGFACQTCVPMIDVACQTSETRKTTQKNWNCSSRSISAFNIRSVKTQ